MRVSESPQGRPGTCAIIPGRHQDPDGWVLTGHVLTGWDPEIVFSFAGINELASLVGLPRRQEWEELKQANRNLQNRIVELEEELNEASQALDAVDGMTKAGYVIRKQTGRPAKQKAA